MDIRKNFATNRTLETTGVWVDLDGKGARLKVARWGNPAFGAKLQEVSAPMEYLLRQGKVEADQQQALMAKVVALTILLDWEGMEENGVEVPHTAKVAERWLVQYPDFYTLVREMSQKVELFQAEQDEAAEQAAGEDSRGS